MDALLNGWRVESQVGTILCFIVLCALMQVGGIPAPQKGNRLMTSLWALWMLVQSLQLLCTLLSLVFVVLSYLVVQDVVGVCMVDGFFGWKLLTLTTFASFGAHSGFQPTPNASVE
jgi:hypothetical protein